MTFAHYFCDIRNGRNNMVAFFGVGFIAISNILELGMWNLSCK